MRLSSVLLLSAFALLITGSGGAVCKTLSIDRGRAAAMMLLLLAASAFTLPLGRVQISAGTALLLITAAWLQRRSANAASALFVAALSGMLTFLIRTACSGLAWDGFLPGLIAAAPAIAALPAGRDQAASAAASPVFYAGCLFLEEYCLFETALLDFGAAAFDAQVSALSLICCTLALRPLWRKKRRAGPAGEAVGKKWA